MDTTAGANYELKFGSPERFSDMETLHSRYTSIRDRMEEKMKEWKNYLKSYRRHPIQRKGGKKDANYGQFKFEIDNSSDMFTTLVLSRPTWATIIPLTAPDKKTKLDWRNKISECWNEEFILPWEEKVENTAYDFFDMQMFMAGIEFWCNKGTVYPENVPIEHVFPDLTAGTNPKKWETLFVLRRESYHSLYKKMDSSDWNKEAIKDLLETEQNRTTNLSEFEKLRLDTKSDETTDNTILLVYAYVKEYDGSITHYVFPEDGIISARSKTDTSKKEAEKRFLLIRKKYCDHMGQIVSIRTYHRFKQYWSGESLADNIFVTKLQGDQAMNRILRSAIRSATTYLNSNNADTQEKLQQTSDQELVVLDADVKVTQTSIQSNTAELFNAVRQLDFDTSKMTRDYLPAGSQNVKGRAITAEEAANQSTQAVEQKEKKTTLFIQQDQRFVEEIYRRSLLVSSGEKEYERLERFKKKMEYYGIPEDAYAFKNVLIQSTFSLMGGSMTARMQGTERLVQLARIKPESEGVRRAVVEAIAAIVGYENVELYFPYKDEIEEMDARRAGMENEILDNPNLNPLNAQVLAKDNHVQDLTLHIPDIENDLLRLEELVTKHQQLPSAMKAINVVKMQEHSIAIDNKFSHCLAHLQMMSFDQGMANYIENFQAKLTQVRAPYISLQKMIRQAIEQFGQENEDNSYMTKSMQLKLQDQQNEVQYRQQLRDIGLGKSIEQAKLREISGKQKLQSNQEKAIVDLETKKAMAEIETSTTIKKASTDIVTNAAKQQQKLNEPTNNE